MKQFKSLFVIFVTSLLCFAGCQDPALEEVKVSLDKSAVSIAKGETIKLTPVVSPSGAAPVLKWSSSDKKVASVTDEGFVSGLAAGEAVITVTADKSSASCKVTVRPVEVESITLDKETAEMLIGDKLSLKATVLPVDADNAAVTWTSLNDKVASVDQNGNVTALAEGNATIVAKAGDVEPAQCAITVSAPVVNVESVTISECPETMVEGDTFQLKAEVKPDNATDKSVIWTSENEEVLTIDENGLATAVEAGEVRITVTSADGGKTDWCMVEVEPKVYHVETVTIDSVPEGNVMLQGETFKFSAKVSPDNASDKSVEWTSSDEEVLSIDQEGNALAVKEGTVTVTVTSVDGGKTASCEITVERINVTGVEISVKPENDKMVEGSEFRFEAIVLPENASIKDVEWSSSDEEVLSVDETGNAKALKAGVATVAVKTVDGDFAAECEITVEPNIIPVQSVSIKESPAENRMLVDDVFTFEAVITPEDASDRNVIWTSTDPEVIKIEADGKAVALKVGKAKITVTTADGGKTASTDEITVELKPVPVESVKITDYAETIKVGSDFQFNAEVTPADATDKSVTWTSENEEVLTIDENGLAKGMEEGTVVVRVTTTDGGKTDECTVVVTAEDIHVESVAIENVPDTIKVGDEFVLEAVITPSNATDTTVTWKSSDEMVAKIDNNGRVKALSAGETTIILKSNDGGKEAKINIEVLSIEVESVKIVSYPENCEMTEGDKFKFVAEVKPENASDRNVIWKSSENIYLSIDKDGNAVAYEPGKVIVTAEAGGKTDACEITIKKVVSPQSVKITTQRTEIYVGESVKFEAEVSPSNAKDKRVTWSSSTSSVLSIDKSGNAYGVSIGESVVLVRTNDGGKTDQLTVKVIPVPVENVRISDSIKEMYVGDSYIFKAEVLPENATDKDITWSSSNTSVLSVNEQGKVKALAEGKSVISVISKDGNKRDEVSVTVRYADPNVPATSAELKVVGGEFADNIVRHGKIVQIFPTYNPVGCARPSNVKWYVKGSYNGNELAEIDSDGYLKAKYFDYTHNPSYYNTNGWPEVVVTLQTENFVANLPVMIYPAVPEQMLVENPPVNGQTISIGETYNFGRISFLPNEAEQRWTCVMSSDRGGFKSMSSDNGNELYFTADEQDVGTWNFLVEPTGIHSSLVSGDFTRNYTITVLPNKETSIEISRKSYTVEEEAIFDLNCKVLPENATYKDVKWESSNPSVASVDNNGRIYAHVSGSVVITATSHHGLKATCNLTVIAKTRRFNVGDYYFSDGTFSSQLVEGKTPVGVIFALADAVGSDPITMGKDHSTSTHGLVVGLESYKTKFSNEMYPSVTIEQVAKSAAASGMISLANRTSICGYSNTMAFRTWGDTWVFLDKLSEASSNYPLPAGTSGWYLPSSGEMDLLVDVKDLLQEKLNAIDESYGIKTDARFWCSTYFNVSSSSYRYVLNARQGQTSGIDSGVINITNDDTYARFIFAF